MLDIVILSVIVIFIVGAIASKISLKRFIKEINKDVDSIHYDRTIYEDDGYRILYKVLKPETYQKIKQSNYTSPEFDIKTAYIDFASVIVYDIKTEEVSSRTIYAYKLRRKLSYKDMELLTQIKEANLCEEWLEELKREVQYNNRENNLLENYK